MVQASFLDSVICITAKMSGNGAPSEQGARRNGNGAGAI
jgi:hypothetical protein